MKETADPKTTGDLSPKDADTPKRGRVRVFDALRGFSLISMVAFHYCYDLVYIAGKQLPWFVPPYMDVWRASISWAFLLIAGCMCTFSRNNLKRAIEYGLVALAIFVVTSIASVDTPISFGIIFCMAACTFLEWILEKLSISPKGYVPALVFFLVFIFLLPVSSGHVGFGGLTFDVPRGIYDCGLFSWAGFPGPNFASGDYYPLLPYFFLYLVGVSLGRTWKESGYPDWAYGKIFPPLEFVGRHTLVIYVLHQPLLLLLAGLL